MGGQNDFNVPILGGEQLYQALKTLNVPTQLVVYPGQNHGLTKVPFLRIGSSVTSRGSEGASASSVNERAGTAGAVAIEAGTGGMVIRTVPCRGR